MDAIKQVKDCGIPVPFESVCRPNISTHQGLCKKNAKGDGCVKATSKKWDDLEKLLKGEVARSPIIVEKPRAVPAPIIVEKPRAVPAPIIFEKPDDFVCGVEVKSPFERTCKKGISTHQGLCKKNAKGDGCVKAISKTWEQIEKELMGVRAADAKVDALIESKVEPSKTAYDIKMLPPLKKIPKQKIHTYTLETDFIIEKKIFKDNPSGSFGEVIPAKFSNTGEPIILKRYKSYRLDNKIPNDVYKEVVFLQYLNQFPETKTVKFYGLCFDKKRENLYLVLERLEKDFSEFTIKYFDRIDKNYGLLNAEQYRIIFYKLIKAYHSLHCLGIVHNDTKALNLMISGNDIRIIDLGMASFMGLEPSEENIKYLNGTPITLAPDTPDKQNGYQIGNRKNLNSDLWSIGATMIQMTLRNWNWLLVEGNQIWVQEKDLSNNFKKIRDISLNLSKKDVFGPLGFDLLLKIMNPNSHLRWCASQALDHPYFEAIDEEPKINRSIVGGRNYKPDYFKPLLGKHRQYTQDEIKNHQFELCYMESMFVNMGNIEIKPISAVDKSEYYITISDLFNKGFHAQNNLEYDVIVNSLQLLKHTISSSDKYQNIITSMNSINIYENVFFDRATIHSGYFSKYVDEINKDIVNDILYPTNCDFDLISPWTIATYYTIYFDNYSKNAEKFQKLPNFLKEFREEVLSQALIFFISAEAFNEQITVNQLIIHCIVNVISEVIGMTKQEAIIMISEAGFCLDLDYNLVFNQSLETHFKKIRSETSSYRDIAKFF